MSIAVDRLVDTIAGMLLQLPAPQRLEVLRQVEAKIRPTASKDELIRKVSRHGRIYAIYVKASLPDGEYKIHIEAKRAIYEPVYDNGDVKVHRDRKSSLRIPIPKWVYEAIGSPAFVRVRVEDDRIIIEPA